MTRATLEVYKLSKECYQEKLNFSRSALAKGMDDARMRVLKYYSDLNLSFLDQDESDEEALTKGEPASEVEAIGMKKFLVPRPSKLLLCLFFFLLM